MLAAALTLAALVAARIAKPIRALADLGSAERIDGEDVASLGLREADATATMLVAAMRKRAEAESARAKQDADFSEAQRVAHIGSWQWDPTTDVTTASVEMFRIFGLDPETESLPPFKEQAGRLYPALSWERINAAVECTLETGSGYEFDVEAFRGETPIWVTIHGEALRNADARVVGLRGTVQDVTAHKHAELGLAESGARFRVLATATREGVAIHDGQRIVEANEAFMRMFGFASHAAMIGSPPIEINAPEARADVFAKVAAGHAEPYETIGLRRDGSTFPIETHARTILYQGRRMRVGVIHDLTRQKAAESALRESEARLKMATEGAGVGTWEIDFTSGIGRRSPEAMALLGSPQATFTPESWLEEVVHAEDRPRITACWAQAVADGAPYYWEFRTAVAPVEGERWVAVRGRTERDADGRPVRAAGILIDVTARKQAELALGESEARLALALKGAQIGVHEIDFVRGVYQVDAAFAQLADAPFPPGVWHSLDDGFRGEWLTRIHPDDAPLRQACLERLGCGTDTERKSNSGCFAAMAPRPGSASSSSSLNATRSPAVCDAYWA